MLLIRLNLVLITAFFAAPALTQAKPNVGYLYPAGARQGTTIQIIAGGQFLRGMTDVYVSGTGIQASVIRYVPPIRNLNRDQRQHLQKRLKEVTDKRLAELPESTRNRNRTRRQRKAVDDKTVSKEKDAKTRDPNFPDHPLLDNLEEKSIREIEHIRTIILNSRRKRQPNRQIAESVLIEVTIDPNATPGNRELRIATKNGLTNPITFQVGSLAEIRELEPNNKKAYPEFPKIKNLRKEEPVVLPALFNGQIMPGDIDRFRFRAERGQMLVINAQARSLIPYLADAVPGWFQATLALYDAYGKEVAFADDYRFDPDPVLLYRIPKDGEYELQIRDSIYRGREDFVYRIAVAPLPFVTQLFPLGAKLGTEAAAAIDGWNLPHKQLSLDTQSGDRSVRHATVSKGKLLSNSIPYAVDALPQSDEVESNNTIETAQSVEPPIIVNGRIDKPGDVDVFSFKGRRGDKVAAEVYARRLNSPLDSILRLTDQSGTVIAWNDDHIIKDKHLHKDTSGLITHHADSYLIAELPADGNYCAHLADAQNNRGPAHAYRLRICPPQPDFAIRMTPSSIHVRPGMSAEVTAHVLRKDGFDGDIELFLKDAPPDFTLDGARIPAGRDRIRMTLTAPQKALPQPKDLKLQAHAEINGQTITRPVVPADDVMQAFLYRHLVPAQQLFVSMQKGRSAGPPLKLANKTPVRIAPGGSARIRFKAPKRRGLKQIKLQLSQPPQGITLHNVKAAPGALEFQLRADKSATQTTNDNLIIEAYRQFTPKRKDGKPAKKRKIPLGTLPAIPIEVLPR